MRSLAFAVMALAGVLPAATAAAQDFPTKPVTILINSEPGGANDVIARSLKDALSAELGQPVLIDFRVGAGGITGMSALKRMDPNGYTIVLTGPGPVTLAPLLYSVPYDPINDFEFVNQAVEIPIVVGIASGLPAKTLPEFVAMAKKEPGKYSYASTGIGTPSHLFGERLKQLAGIDLLHVPYKGPPAGAIALAAGQVSIFMTTSSTLQPHVESGKARGLVIMNATTRLKSLPETQTATEAGFADLTIPGWMGLVAPKGTPKPILDKLDNAIQKALADPKTRESLERVSFVPIGRSGPAFTEQLKKDAVLWKGVITQANIKVE